MAFVSDFFVTRFQRNPDRLRSVLRAVQALRPVVPLGGGAFVLGAKPVREVFRRDTELRFGAPSVPKMKLGDFILGMDDCPQYRAEKKALQAAGIEVATRFGPAVEQEANRVAAGLKNRTRIDLLGEFVDPVVTAASARFYGVPYEKSDGSGLITSAVLDTAPGQDTLRGWMTILGGIISSGSPAPFGLDRLADAAAEELRSHLDGAVGSRSPRD